MVLPFATIDYPRLPSERECDDNDNGSQRKTRSIQFKIKGEEGVSWFYHISDITGVILLGVDPGYSTDHVY